MGNGSFSAYLFLFSFILVLAGVVIGASSVGMLSDYSELSAATIRLFIGILAALGGAVILLMGFLSSGRNLRSLY